MTFCDTFPSGVCLLKTRFYEYPNKGLQGQAEPIPNKGTSQLYPSNEDSCHTETGDTFWSDSRLRGAPDEITNTLLAIVKRAAVRSRHINLADQMQPSYTILYMLYLLLHTFIQLIKCIASYTILYMFYLLLHINLVDQMYPSLYTISYMFYLLLHTLIQLIKCILHIQYYTCFTYCYTR